MSAANRHTLAIIIATKDHPHDLRRTLASLVAQSVLPRQVILADGGERTVEGMAQEFPDLPIVYRRILPPSGVRQQNLAVNDVEPCCDLIAFVDDDMVLEPGALAAMLAFWEAAPSDVGGAVFNIVNHDAPPRAVRLKSLFGMDTVRPGVVLRSGYQTQIGKVLDTQAVRWLNSGATVWRRQVWETWRLDEWFAERPHLSDVDFSFRVGRRFRLMAVAPAVVREIPGPGRRRDDEVFGRWQVVNRLHFVSKHPELSLARCCWALVGQVLVNISLGLVERDRRLLRRARGNLAGWWHAARHPGEVLAGHADAEHPLRNGCRPG